MGKHRKNAGRGSYYQIKRPRHAAVCFVCSTSMVKRAVAQSLDVKHTGFRLASALAQARIPALRCDGGFTIEFAACDSHEEHLRVLLSYMQLQLQAPMMVPSRDSIEDFVHVVDLVTESNLDEVRAIVKAVEVERKLSNSETEFLLWGTGRTSSGKSWGSRRLLEDGALARALTTLLVTLRGDDE